MYLIRREAAPVKNHMNIASLLLGLLAASTAAAQVTVQEYTIPSGHGIHDVWADAAAASRPNTTNAIFM